MEKGKKKKLDILRIVGMSIIIIFVAWLHLLQPIWLANIVIMLTVIIGGYPLFKAGCGRSLIIHA